MTGVVVVLAGVLVGRAIATADMPTDQANAQVDPTPAALHAIFAAEGAGRDVLHLFQVGTRRRVELSGLDQVVKDVAGGYKYDIIYLLYNKITQGRTGGKACSQSRNLSGGMPAKSAWAFQPPSQAMIAPLT